MISAHSKFMIDMTPARTSSRTQPLQVRHHDFSRTIALQGLRAFLILTNSNGQNLYNRHNDRVSY